jgi:Kef-type K+ transport system membrane component KefB
VLDTPVLWLIGVTTLVVAIVGKWGGSAVAARISGQSWRDANAVGALMNTRGLTEIVIVTIGRELGVVSPAFFSTMVLVAIVTTLMTMPSLAALGHAPRLGRTLSSPALLPLRLRQRSNGRVLEESS